MKTWQRRTKLKPKPPFRIMWLGFRTEKEKRDWELSESIYRKETYWPDRLTPLTEEELKFKAECEANRPTFEQACKAFDELYLHHNDRPITLISEKVLKELNKWIKEQNEQTT